MLSVRVDGIPVPQPRPRATVARDRSGRAVIDPKTGRERITVFSNSANVSDWKKLVHLTVSRAWGKPICQSGPIGVYLEFFLPRPKRKVWKTKPMPRELHTSKPDGDNLAKAVIDALNGLIWNDDNQIADMRSTKYVCAGDEKPGVRITIKFYG